VASAVVVVALEELPAVVVLVANAVAEEDVGDAVVVEV
jgi:hypothetical protein